MFQLPTGRAMLDPERILEEAGIRQGMRVADLGVGAVGHFLFPASRMVGDSGTVFAVDILKTVLDANKSRLKISGGQNIVFIWGDLERNGGTRIPDAAIDLAIMASILFCVDKKAALAEVKRIMGTDGILLVIEWKPQGAPMGPSPEKRLSREQTITLGQEAGLVLKKEFDAGPYHYGVVFTKPRQ
jgi:ubiquinone/menaquinone biosynthesis C-methylase UbiE